MNRMTAALVSFLVASSTVCLAAPPAAELQPSDPTSLAVLETRIRYSAVDSAEFGRTIGSYWAAIARAQDFSRAHSFFDDLSASAPGPNATLLAEKASATGAYTGWIYQHRSQVAISDQEMSRMLAGAATEYQQALALDPDNFAALYGYAVFEGYRPGGLDHQKELLAKLETLRASKPYLPWAMVDQLEKTGRPE